MGKRNGFILPVFITALCICVLIPGGYRTAGPRAADQPPTFTPTEQDAIRRVIRSQIQAFERDDGPAAFALASPSIQERFGTAQNFLKMVRTSYPAVYRPRHYEFLELTLADDVWVQKVIFIGPDGLAVMALYPMVRLRDGTWRTDGCALVPMAAKDA